MKSQNINITVQTKYIKSESSPELQQFVFSYTITISNHSNSAAKLLSRYWSITDANGEIIEVRGPGVIGQQPRILPSQSYTYTSGTVLKTEIGFMKGSYQMVDDENNKFDVLIDTFRLEVPGTFH